MRPIEVAFGCFIVVSSSKAFQPSSCIRPSIAIIQQDPLKRSTLLQSNEVFESDVSSSYEDIEPYIGPIASLDDMEGGITISELALNVFAGPSLVAPGRGLFLGIYEESEEDDDDGIVEEIIVPQGTPLCGYARGHFSDQEEGDKSVGFLFRGDVEETAVFYERQLMSIGDAIRMICSNGEGIEIESSMWGHTVSTDTDTGRTMIAPDQNVTSRIFVPDTPEKDEDKFGPTCLGVFANDLAYDPDSNEEEYGKTSEANNILQLVWRLARDEKRGNLVPSWPVVITKKDVRMVNTVPMEVGLQYGFAYWNSFQGGD